MQTLLITLLTVLALVGLPTWTQAQGAITTTTITEPITTLTPQNITVASATGITAGIFLVIDNEHMRVAQSYVSGTQIPVVRTRRPATHSDNATVWIAPIASIVETAPQGSCTRGTAPALYTYTFIASTGAIAVCRADLAGYTGVELMWNVTDVSGANGTQSGAPPATQ